MSSLQEAFVNYLTHALHYRHQTKFSLLAAYIKMRRQDANLWLNASYWHDSIYFDYGYKRNINDLL